MKKIISFLLLLFILITFPISLQALDYEIPENFDHLMDITYDTICQTIKVDDEHFFDIFLVDENFMALSALARAKGTEMTLSEIKSYFQKSMVKYAQKKYFTIMVLAFDLKGDTDFSDLPSRITLTNSKANTISGEELEKYDQIFVLQYPREEFINLYEGESSYIVQVKGYDNKTYNAVFEHNYCDQIPPKITELVQILRGN